MNPHLKTAYDYGAKHARIMFEKFALTPITRTGDPPPMTDEQLAWARQYDPPPERFRPPPGAGINFDPGYLEWLQGRRKRVIEGMATAKQAAAGELEAGDILARMGGAVPLAGPAIAGETGGIETAPGFGSHVGQRTAMGALRGQTIGGLGGAALGGGLGALAPYAGKALDIEALEDLEPSKGALIGALLGGGLGAGIGGGIGAGRGREKGEQEVATTQELLQAQRQAAMQQRVQQALQQAYQRGGMEQSQLAEMLGGGYE